MAVDGYASSGASGAQRTAPAAQATGLMPAQRPVTENVNPAERPRAVAISDINKLIKEISIAIYYAEERTALDLINQPQNNALLKKYGMLSEIIDVVQKKIPAAKVNLSVRNSLFAGDRKSAESTAGSESTKRIFELAYGKDAEKELRNLADFISSEAAALAKHGEIVNLLYSGQPEKAMEELNKAETQRAFDLSKEQKTPDRTKMLAALIKEKEIPWKKMHELRILAEQGAGGLAQALKLIETDRGTQAAIAGENIEEFKKELEQISKKTESRGEIHDLLSMGQYEAALRAVADREGALTEAGINAVELRRAINTDSMIDLATTLIVERGSRDRQMVQAGEDLLRSIGDDLEKEGVDAEKLIAALIVLQNVEVLKNSGNYRGAIDLLEKNGGQYLQILNESKRFDGEKVLAGLRDRAGSVSSGLGNMCFRMSFGDPLTKADAKIENVRFLDENGQEVEGEKYFEYTLSDGVKKQISLTQISELLSRTFQNGQGSYITVPPQKAMQDTELFAKALYYFYLDQRAKLFPTAESKTLDVISMPEQGGRAYMDLQVNIDKELVDLLEKQAGRSDEIFLPMQASYTNPPIMLPGGIVEDAHFVGNITDPQKFAGESPFAAFKISLWQKIVPATSYESIPPTVTDSVSPDELRMLANQLMPGSEAQMKYFHRPVNETERQSLRTYRESFAKESAEYQMLSELMTISALDVQIPGNIKAKLTTEAQIKALDELSAKSPLIAELRDSYYADGEYSPEEASALYSLADWMEEQKIEVLTPDADILGTRSQDNDYVKGMEVLATHVWASLIGFDPRKAEDRIDSMVLRILNSTAQTASMVLSQGSRPTMASIGISGAENWKIALLKKQYWGGEKWAELVSSQEYLEQLISNTTAQIDKLNADTTLTTDQKREQIQPHVAEYSYLKGRLDTLFAQMFAIDEKFFDWFVDNYANETKADKFKDFLLEPINESQFGSSVIDPFTKEPIELSQLPEILQSAAQNNNIRADLSRGWLSLDPSRGGEESRRAKMAMALMISYLKLDDGELEKTNPNAAYASMAAKQMFFASSPVQHLGAAIKGDLLFLFRNDPVKKGMLARGLEKPDEFDKGTIAALMDVIKMVSPDKDKDAQYLRLKKVHDELGEEKITVRSDTFKDVRAQEIMQGYYYLGKVLSKNAGLNFEDKKEGDKSWGDFFYNGGNMVTGGMLDQILNERYDRPERPLGGNWYKTSLSEIMGADSGVGFAASAVASIPYEFGGTLVRFGPWMGAQFGWSLPFTFAKSLVWDIPTGKTTMAINETNGLPIEDKDGRLVFKEAGLEDAGKNLLNLVTQMWLFRNDPFLLYGWLGVGEDIDDNQLVSAAVKIWASNFYLMMPGKNGFWDSTWGRGMTLDRYAWKLARMAWDFKENMAELRKQGVDAAALEAKVQEAGLEPILNATKNYSSFNDFARNFVETAAQKGSLGAFTEKIVQWDSMHRFLSGSLGRAARKAGGVAALIASPNPLLSKLQRGAQSNDNAYAGQKAVDLTFKSAFQYANLMHWEARGLVSGGRRLGFDRVSSGALLAEVDPSSKQVVCDVDRNGQIQGIQRGSGDQVEQRIAEEIYRSAYDESNNPRQITFNIKTGENTAETVTLPVSRVVIDSSTALMSEQAITIIPSGPKGVAVDASSVTSAEVHINTNLLNILCLDREYKAGNVSDQALQMARTQILDDPKYFKAAEFLTRDEFKAILDGNNIRLNGELSQDQIPLTRQTALDLVADLKRDALTSVTPEDLVPRIRAVVGESYSTRSVNSTLSDRLTFELCGNIADGNRRPGMLNTRTHFDDNFKLTDEGRRLIQSHIMSQVPEADAALITQVTGKVELYLDAQDFARQVRATDAINNKKISSMTDSELRAEAERLLALDSPTRQQKVEASALVGEAVYRQTKAEAIEKAKNENKPTAGIEGFRLTAGQIMSGYVGAKATKDTPVNINFETGEGKTYTQALDAFLRLMEKGKRVILNTATCDPFAFDNYKDTSGILGRLGVDSELLRRSSSDSQIRLALADNGRKRVVFADFDTPRFAQLFTVNPQSGGVPVFVPNDRYLGIIIDEGDYSIWDLRNNPAIVSTGGDSRAADADKVLLAEDLVKSWFDGSALRPECARFVDNAESKENIVLSKDGVVEIQNKLGGKKIRFEELTPYIKNALFAHSFLRDGIDYTIKGYKVFMRRYLLRDPATGRNRPGMQLDLNMHKAVQAMIGVRDLLLRRTVTDPGVPPVSITVPEFLKGIGYSSYSGTWSPLEGAMAREGVLTFSTESSFARTRVDHGGVVFENGGKQLDAVVQRAMTDAENPKGGACLIHAAAQTRAEGSGVLSIQQIFEGLKQKYKAKGFTIEEEGTEKERKAGKGAFTATMLGEEPVRVMILVDEGDIEREKTKAKGIGAPRTITLTDIASRAMNPGIQDAIEKFLSEEPGNGPAKKKVYLNTIVTAWDKSVRDFMQRIARAGRPVGGERVPASSVAYFNAEDKGFSPDMRAYLAWAIAQNGGKPVVAISSDFPLISTKYTIDTLVSDAQRIVEDLRQAGALADARADEIKTQIDGINAGEGDDSDKRVQIAALIGGIGAEDHGIVSRYWQSTEQQLVDEVRRGDLARTESFEAKYADTLRALSAIADGSADPEVVRGLFGRAMKESIDVIMKHYKISDANARGAWDLKGLTEELKRMGISVEIDPKIQSAEDVRSQLGAYVDNLLSNPRVDNLQKMRLVQFLKEQIGSLKLEYEALKRQTENRPDAEMVWKKLDSVFSESMSLTVAFGKQGWGFKRVTVLDSITGLPRSGLTFRLPSIRTLAPATVLGAGSDRVKVNATTPAAGNPEIERSLETRIRTIVNNNGHVNDGAPAATIRIDDVEYDLRLQKRGEGDINGVKELNDKLGELGSDKRVYFNPHTREYIYGTIDPDIRDTGASERQIVFITEEVISPSIRDWAVAFIPRTPVDLFGDDPKHETIIRNKAIEEAFDRMADSAFKQEGHLLPGSAFARAIFRANGVNDAEIARRAEIIKGMTQAVSSHESGHAAIYSQPEYVGFNVRYVHPLPHEMIELLADVRILQDISKGVAGNPDRAALKEEQTRLYSHLYYLANKSGPLSAEVTKVIEGCMDERRGIDFGKLAIAADGLTRILTDNILLTDRTLKGSDPADPQRQADVFRQIRRDILRELGALNTSIRTPSSTGSARQPADDGAKLAGQVDAQKVGDAMEEFRAASSGGRSLSPDDIRNIAQNNGLNDDESAQFRAQIEGISGAQSGNRPDDESISALRRLETMTPQDRASVLVRGILRDITSSEANLVDRDIAGKVSVVVIPEADFKKYAGEKGDAVYIKDGDRYVIYVREGAAGLDRTSSKFSEETRAGLYKALAHEAAEIEILEKKPAGVSDEQKILAAHLTAETVVQALRENPGENAPKSIARKFEDLRSSLPQSVNGMVGNANRSIGMGAKMGFGMSLILYNLIPELTKNGLRNVMTSDYWSESIKQSWAAAVRGAMVGTRDNLLQDYLSAVICKTNYGNPELWSRASGARKAAFTGVNVVAMMASGVFDDALLWAEQNMYLLESDNPYEKEYYHKMVTMKIVQGSVSNAAFELPQLLMVLGLNKYIPSDRLQQFMRTGMGVATNIVMRDLFDRYAFKGIQEEYLGTRDKEGKFVMTEDVPPIPVKKGKVAEYTDAKASGGNPEYISDVGNLDKIGEFLFSNPAFVSGLSQATGVVSTGIEVRVATQAATKVFQYAPRGLYDWSITAASKEVLKTAVVEKARQLAGKEAASLTTDALLQSTYGLRAAKQVASGAALNSLFTVIYAAKFGFDIGRDMDEDHPWKSVAIAGAGGTTIGLIGGLLTYGASKAALGGGPVGLIAGLVGATVGGSMMLYDIRMRSLDEIKQSEEKDRITNLDNGIKLAQRGWIFGVESNESGLSKEEIANYYPDLTADGIDLYYSMSNAGFKNPLNNFENIPDSWGSWLYEISPLGTSWLPDALHSKCEGRIEAHPTDWQSANKLASDMQDSAKLEEFLDRNLPNWRYLLYNQQERDLFSRKLGQIYQSELVQNYIKKIESGEVVPRNIAYEYAADPSLIDRMPPSEFWAKSGLSPDQSKDEANEEVLNMNLRQKEFLFRKLTSDDYAEFAKVETSQDLTDVVEWEQRFISDFVTLSNLSGIEPADEEIARSLRIPSKIMPRDLVSFPRLWSEIKDILNRDGALNRKCFEMGLKDASELEKSDKFEIVVAEALREVLNKAGKRIDGKLMLDKDSFIALVEYSKTLPDQNNLSLNDIVSGKDIKIPLANIRNYSGLYEELVNVLKKTNALSWAMKDCNATTDFTKGVESNLGSLTDQKLAEVLTLAMGRLLAANGMKLETKNSGVRGFVSNYLFSLDNLEYELDFVDAEIAAILANPRYHYFDYRSRRTESASPYGTTYPGRS